MTDKHCNHSLEVRNYENLLNSTGLMYGLCCGKCGKWLIALSKEMYTDPKAYRKVLLYLKENNLADRIS